MPSWWDDMWKPITPPGNCATGECAAGVLPDKKASPAACFATCFAIKTGSGLLLGKGLGAAAGFVGPKTGSVVDKAMNSPLSLTGSEILGVAYCAKECNYYPEPPSDPTPSFCIDPINIAP